MRAPVAWLGIVWIVWGGSVVCQEDGRVHLQPARPVRGAPVAMRYDPSGTALAGRQPVQAEVMVVRETLLPAVLTVPLSQTGSQWSGSLTVPDSQAVLLLFKFVAGDRVDDNDHNAWSLLVHAPDGTPVRGAHLARAASLLSKRYFAFFRQPDSAAAERDLSVERSLYPDNWRAAMLSWTLLMQSPGGEEGAVVVRRELDAVYARERGNQATVAALLPWFEQTGQIDRAEEIRSAAIAEDSAGDVARSAALASVYQERDPAARADKAFDVLGRFSWGDDEHDDLLSLAASALARLGRYEEAVRTAGKRRSPDGSVYNAVAWPLVEKGERLDEAVRWAERGVELTRAWAAGPKPDLLSQRAWDSRRTMRLGMMLDTYAFGLFKLGRFEEAEDAYEEADSLFGGELAETAERLVETYLKNGKPDSALALARRMISTSAVEDRTEALFEQAYLAVHGSPEGMEGDLEELRRTARERTKASLLEERLSRPAPAFSLQALDGSTVSSDALRGKVVILDFWATWCGPCTQSFPYLQQFYDQHKANPAIALYAVNTWEQEQGDKRQRTVRKFLADAGYTFPVLFDENTVERYGVEGIPTRFVIDQEGTIRFKSVGFEGGEKMLTQMSLQIELLLDDSPTSSR